MNENANVATPIDLGSLFERVDLALERATHLSRSEIFAPSLGESAIAAVEKAIGLRLPEGLRQAYLWHDGLRYYGPFGPKILAGLSLIPGFYWFSLPNLVDRWQWDRKVEKRRCAQECVAPHELEIPASKKRESSIKPLDFNSRWIPIAISSNNLYCHVDLDPAESGVPGQLFAPWGIGTPIAPSFIDCLAPLPDALEEGRLVYDERRGWVLARTRSAAYRLSDLL